MGDGSDFAPDAYDVATSHPSYGSSEHAFSNGVQESNPKSPTYVREKSPFPSWASPTYSYTSPPYLPPSSRDAKAS